LIKKKARRLGLLLRCPAIFFFFYYIKKNRGCFAPDFVLFKQIIGLMGRAENRTTEGLNNIVSLKGAMNNGLSDNLKAAFRRLF
jgi:hypothetical protein